MEKAYKFRIYPTKEQEIMFQKNFGCVRYVYNHYLEMRIEKYRQDKSNMRYSQCSADLTQLKKSLIWLQDADSTSLQTALRSLNILSSSLKERVKNPYIFPFFYKQISIRTSH